MEIKLISETHNPTLRRKEISFEIDHQQTGNTPSRKDVRSAIARATKSDESLVFIRRFLTKTGTHIATGWANVYEDLEQAKLVEPEHIIKRNVPPPQEQTSEQKGGEAT